MSDIPEITQQLSIEPIVVLYELDLSRFGGQTYRFTSSIVDEGATAEIVQFGGHEYTPIECTAEGFEWSGKGQLPTPKFKMRNMPIITQLVVENDDLLGALFRRIRTFKRFIGPTSDGQSYFGYDVFKIERKSTHNKYYIEWELSCPIDQDGRWLPGRKAQATYCPWIYRYWNGTTFEYDNSTRGCSWKREIRYYDGNGNLTTDKSKDKCGKHLSDCLKRFGEHNSIPFGGFPGMLRSGK